MNRELKFRLWDKKLQKMVFTGFHIFGEVTMFNMIGQYCYETKSEGASLERYNDLEVMQFTGLKDRNGTDIYEGDIVGRSRDGKGIDKKKIVNWHNAYVATGFNISNTDKKEVIGNIWENPDIEIDPPTIQYQKNPHLEKQG